MKKELKEVTKGDVANTSHVLRHRSLQEVVSVCRGTIYVNFGDSVPIPKRERFQDNYRLAMAIRAYYQLHERRLCGRRSFAALLTVFKKKLLMQTRLIEDTLLTAERAKVIDQKAIAILQKLHEDLAG